MPCPDSQIKNRQEVRLHRPGGAVRTVGRRAGGAAIRTGSMSSPARASIQSLPAAVRRKVLRGRPGPFPDEVGALLYQPEPHAEEDRELGPGGMPERWRAAPTGWPPCRTSRTARKATPAHELHPATGDHRAAFAWPRRRLRSGVR